VWYRLYGVRIHPGAEKKKKHPGICLRTGTQPRSSRIYVKHITALVRCEGNGAETHSIKNGEIQQTMKAGTREKVYPSEGSGSRTPVYTEEGNSTSRRV